MEHNSNVPSVLPWIILVINALSLMATIGIAWWIYRRYQKTILRP